MYLPAAQDMIFNNKTIQTKIMNPSFGNENISSLVAYLGGIKSDGPPNSMKEARNVCEDKTHGLQKVFRLFWTQYAKFSLSNVFSTFKLALLNIFPPEHLHFNHALRSRQSVGIVYFYHIE